MKGWAGWAIAASRTRKVMRLAGRDLGAMLAATPFSSDCAVLASYRRLSCDPAPPDRRGPRDRNVVVGAGLLALVLERHLDGSPERVGDTCLRDSQAGDRYLLRPDRLGPVAEDRPHFYVATLGTASADKPAS
jgi:hypothetical protein